MVVTGCQENKSCSKVLNFLERLDDRIRCTHNETVAVVNSCSSLMAYIRGAVGVATRLLSPRLFVVSK